MSLNSHRADLAPDRRRTKRPSVEVPTLLLILAVYGGWILLTAEFGHWPHWVVIPATIVVLVLHSSLQHEIIHGHPTRWSRVNRLLGIVPLSLWLPFERYRQTHLKHHVDERLTDPHDDTESNYWTPEQWSREHPVMRAVMYAQQTLAGRVLIGSFWRIGHFLRVEVDHFMRDERHSRDIWIRHILWCVPVIAWVVFVCHIPLWLYVLAMVIPANGILQIRPFAEHRAREDAGQRTAIVERSWFLGPLFLFNNLHALHHEVPRVPWYEYNARYRADRERLIRQNGGLVYSGYFDVARRFLFRPHDVLEHPMGRVPYRFRVHAK